MAKFKEAMGRLYNGVFVCKNCKSKIRTSAQKVNLKKVSCRKCSSKALRPKHRETKG